MNAKLQIGDRVGAILGSEGSTVSFFGYGTYEGHEVPDEKAGGMGPLLRGLGRVNPKIKLDNGKIVWGCECWWGPEEEIKTKLAGSEVVVVDVDEARKQLGS